MNKTIVWVIVAVVVIAGAAFFIMRGSGPNMSGTGATSTSTQTASSGTIKDLMARGSSECQVTDPSNGSSGTVYVGDGKMRGDFTSQTQSGTITSHMISDGQTVYVWSSAMAQGIKMAVSASQSTTTSSSQNPYNENVNYTCSPWTPNSSEFALPAGVTFEDMTSLMQGGASTGTSGSVNAGACGACDQAPNASAKAQCRAALHC